MTEPSVLQRDILLQLARGELNQHDEEQESMWVTVTSMFDTIREKLTDAIKSALSQVLKLADGYVPAITAIVSSVVTLLTSLVTLAIQYNSTSVKVALGAAILASLTSFISNVAILFKAFGDWNSTAAQGAAVELTSHIAASISAQPEVVANSLDYKTWVTMGVTSLVAILFAGIGLSGATSWRDLVMGGNVLEGIRKTSNNVNNVADFILKDLVGLELDPDYPQCLLLEKLAEEGARLQQISVASFVQKPDEFYKLKTYVHQVINATSRKVSNNNSRRYSTVRQLLVEIYRQLSNKLDAINAIMATKPRQVTVGLMLSGPPGHGKSEFGKYICKRVASALGYPTDLYCLNKKTDGFFEPYGGAAIGVFNEFMAMRSEDAILRDLNLILSSDPMNFEAACLEGKSQPCQLKIVFLTSNSHNPEIVRVLSEGAVRATWDRIYHIAVEDPLCLGRHHPNPHRQPDFSHLQFNLVNHQSPDNITFTSIELAAIEERLIGRCAHAERDFIREVLLTEQSEPIASALMDRSRNLANLMIRCEPFDRVTPNSLGREFFITRFQGLPGSGKSTLAEQLARECSALFSFPIQYSRVEEEFIPNLTSPLIYVLDDWVEESNVLSYVQKMNQTHELSMFFLTSNSVFHRVGFRTDPYGSTFRAIGGVFGLNTACPWDASHTKFPLGTLRRLGLQGFIRAPDGQVVQTPEMFQKTITFYQNFVIRDAYDVVGNREILLDSIFKSFRVFLSRPTEYVLVHGLPPAMKDPGVTLEAPNASDLIQGLRSPTRCMQAYMGKADGFRLLVSDRLKGPSASSQTMVNTWLVVEEPSNDPDVLESVWSRMCATFGRTFPGEALLLHLTESNSTYYYEGGVAYCYGPDTLRSTLPVEINGDTLIYYRDANTPIRVTAAQFAAARLYNQYDGPLHNCSISEYRAINRAFTSVLAEGVSNNFVAYYLLEELRSKSTYSTKALWLKATLQKNPIFWIGVSLLGMVCAGGMIYGFVKLCQAIHYYFTSAPVTVPNTSPPAETRGHNPAKNILRRITTNSDGPRETRGPKPATVALRRMRVAHNAAMSPLEFMPDHPPRQQTPAAVLKLLQQLEDDGKNAEFAIRSLINSNPAYEEQIMYNYELSDHYSNMLRLEDMNKVPSTDLEVFHKAIKKSFVHVSSSDGSCYGVCLQANLILTVSHMFTEVGEQAVIRHDGSSYEARVVFIDRDRDLSLIRVYDKSFPNLPNIRRHFATREELTIPKYGFFMRCGPDLQCMGGLISYYKSTTVPITSTENPNYRLSSKLIVHIASALDKTRTFIKLGDCGFPMVAKCSDGLRMTGIHNGYNQTEKSYYSSFSREDFDDFVAEAHAIPNHNSHDAPYELHEYQIDNVQHHGLMAAPYAEAIEHCIEDPKYGHYSDTLHIIGYSSKLAIRSVPKGSHKPIGATDMITKPLTLPAAYSMTYVEDSSSLAVNINNVPSPLFTQCLKYDARKCPSYDSYLLEEATGLVMQDCVSRYSNCRFLRLHETLNGLANSSLPPIETRTSAGPLLKVLYNVATKAPLLDVITPDRGRPTLIFRKDLPAALMVRNHYKQYYDSLINRLIPPILFSKDCAKVELIDADKAKKGKVRLFNEVDFSINLLFRSLFGDFASKVMKGHTFSPIRMGQDPYVASTAIYKQFNEIQGEIVSTDFSAFDKQLPMELIYGFCWIVSRCMAGTGLTQSHLDDIYASLARSLTYVFHTCKGTIYLVDRGNESGTFVTTLLNSVSVDILTSYTLCRKWLNIMKFTPSLSEMSAHCRKAILGDDRALKVSPLLGITQKDLIDDSELFCLKCTPAKTSAGLDFCSRAFTWDDRYNICWPALKVSSVTSQLHWTTNFSEDQLITNCDNALFEASLHSDPLLFQNCLSDALTLLKHYQIPLENLSFHSRDLARKRFSLYVRNDGSIPDISEHVRHQWDEDPVTYVHKIRRAHDVLRTRPDIQQYELQRDYGRLLVILRSTSYYFLHRGIPDAYRDNPISFLYQILQHFRLRDRPEVSFSLLPDNAHACHMSLYGLQSSARCTTKRGAERLAYQYWLESYLPQVSPVERVKENKSTEL